jgi:hypothetical protein
MSPSSPPGGIARDRAIIAAFDSAASGREVAAASGLDLDETYKIHRKADSIRSDAEMDRRMAERRRSTEELNKVGIWADSTLVPRRRSGKPWRESRRTAM